MPYELLDDEIPEQNSALSLGQESLRHGARTASNIGTRAVGLPGDVFSLINQFIAKPAAKAITGQEGVPYEDTFLGKALPTTETHRRGLEQLSGDYLNPKNKIEKFTDDVLEDTALLFSPSGLARAGMKGGKVLKSLFKSIGANVAGESAKQISGSEGAGDVTKLGSLLFLSLLDQPSAAKQIGKLYQNAEKNLPQGASTNAAGLSKNLDQLERAVTKGRPATNLSPPEKFVLDQVNKVKNLVTDGKIDIEQAWAQKRSLNQELASLYKEVPGKKEQKTVKNLSKQLNGYINQSIRDYGKRNPEFYKPYKEAEEAFGTLAQSNFVSRWVDKNVVQSPVTIGLMHMVGGNIGGLASGTVGSILPYQAAKLGYRIAKSPTLAKIYGNTLKSAVKEDAKSFNKYLKELDAGLQKEESTDMFEFLD